MGAAIEYSKKLKNKSSDFETNLRENSSNLDPDYRYPASSYIKNIRTLLYSYFVLSTTMNLQIPKELISQILLRMIEPLTEKKSKVFINSSPPQRYKIVAFGSPKGIIL